MIKLSQTGSFDNTMNFLKRAKNKTNIRSVLEKYGSIGVRELAKATPKRTGMTANSWRYQLTIFDGHYTIEWINDNVNDGVNIAMILQTGHGTRNGGYVQGIDYINPALRPVFEKMSDEIWEEVTK